jgi:hypothetical protein
MKINLFFSAAIMIILVSNAIGQIPKKISYQGLLTSPSGSPAMDGNYSLQFSIFDTSNAGSSLWTETQPGINVQRGTFSAILGSATPMDLSFNNQYYLEVKAIAGPGISSPLTFIPRSQLTSAPYSMSSLKSVITQNADSARIAGTIPDNIVTSAKIVDGTIQRVNVQTSFKAPYSDTADYAKAATFPRPAYNSGWLPIPSYQDIVQLNHNLGGDSSDYVVIIDLVGNSNLPYLGSSGISDYNSNRVVWYNNLTSTSMLICAGSTVWGTTNYRVRIWIAGE